MIELAAGFFFASSIAGWLVAFIQRMKVVRHEHQISDMGHSIQASTGMMQHQHTIIVSLQKQLAEYENDGEEWKHGKN